MLSNIQRLLHSCAWISKFHSVFLNRTDCEGNINLKAANLEGHLYAGSCVLVIA